MWKLCAALVAALAWASPALAESTLTIVETEPIGPAKVIDEGPAAELGDVGGYTGGCWRQTARVGDSTWLGHFWLYFSYAFCSNYNRSLITAYGDTRAWPDVGGQYAFDGYDGDWLVGGGVGHSYVEPHFRGRFHLFAPALGDFGTYTAHGTLWTTAGAQTWWADCAPC